MNNEVDRCEKTQHEEGGPWVPAGERMVKKFVRSDAGREEQLPSDIRTPEALVRTMDYLVEEVIGKEERLIACHNFVWDRTRAIRNDLSIQQVSHEHDVLNAVDCHERSARFLILSLHVLSNDDQLRGGERFDVQQDVEQLNKTFTSLWDYYDAHRMEIDFPNEPEFRSYQILLEIQMASPDLEDKMQSWPYSVLTDPRVSTALRLYQLATNILRYRGPLKPLTPEMVAQMNACAFWDVLSSPAVSYMMACMAEISFYLVRFGFLKALWKSVKSAPKAQQERMKEWTIPQMRDYLAFDFDEQVEGYCADLDIGFYGMNDNGEKYLDFARDSIFAFEIDNAPRKQIFSQLFVEYKRFHRNYVSVINGGTVREAIEAHSVFDQEVEMKGTTIPEGESSMFFPEMKQASSGGMFGGFQSQSSAPTFGSGLDPSAKPFQTGLGGALAGQQSFEDAVADSGKTTGMFSNPIFARPASQQSNSTPFNPFSTNKSAAVDPSAPFDANHAFGSAKFSPTKNIFGPKPAVEESTNTSFLGAPSSSSNPFLPQKSSQESGLGGNSANFNNPFAPTSQSTPAPNTGLSQPSSFANQSQSIFAKPQPPIAGFSISQASKSQGPSWTPPKTEPLKPSQPFSWPAATTLETSDSTSRKKVQEELFPAIKDSASQQSTFSFQPFPQQPAVGTPPPQYSEFSSQQIATQPEAPQAAPPTFSFSTTHSQSTSPVSPEKPAFPAQTQQTVAKLEIKQTPAPLPEFKPAQATPPQPSIEVKPIQAAPQPPSFEFKSRSAAPPAPVPNSSLKRAAPQVSTTPPSSPPKSAAQREQQYIEITARLGLTQPSGLLHEYLEYTLEKLLPHIVDQHHTEVFTQKLTRLRTNTLIRKFGRLWKRLAYESSLNRRATQRRAKFAESLRVETEKKRRKEDDLQEIMAAMEDSKRVREEHKRMKKEAQKAKKEEEARLVKLRQEQTQLAGKKRKSVRVPSSTLSPVIQPESFRHHKRSRTLGSSMLPPPRPVQQPTNSSFRASIFSSGNSSFGLLSRSNSVRDSQRSRSDTRPHQDKTRTDFFRLLAHDVDPETPLIPLTQSQVDAKARREKEEREAKLNSIYNRRRVGQSATPPRASPAPQPSFAASTPSSRESSPRPSYDPEADDIIRQIRETRDMFTEGSEWFKEQSTALEKEYREEKLRSSISSQGSPRVSINGVEYQPLPGPSMSRTERLIRGYGLDKPKPKYKPLTGSDYVPVPMSKRTATRYQMGVGEVGVDVDGEEEIEKNGTAKKRRKHGLVDRSYRPDPRFDEEENEEDYDEVPPKRVKAARHAFPAPRVKVNSTPFTHLQPQDDELLEDDDEELLENDEDPNRYYYNGAEGDTEELVEDEEDDLLEEDDEEDDLVDDDDEDDYDQGYLRPGSQPYEDAPTPATQVSHVSSGPGATKDDAIALSDSD